MKRMHKHCTYGMQKVHRDYKNAEQRRDEGCGREESHTGKWHAVGGDEIHRRGVIQRIKRRHKA
jgi:cation transport regulator ChaB